MAVHFLDSSALIFSAHWLSYPRLLISRFSLALT